MSEPNFRWLASVIAAHRDQTVKASRRICYVMLILQEMGLKTDYLFPMFFGGPHGDAVYSDLQMLSGYGFTEEIAPFTHKTLSESWAIDIEKNFLNAIKVMEESNIIILQLAATYIAFDSWGDRNKQMGLLTDSKGSKCSEENLLAMFTLLKDLNWAGDSDREDRK